MKKTVYLFLSDWKYIIRTIIRRKFDPSCTEEKYWRKTITLKTVPVLIIIENKLVQFSKKGPAALN